MRADRIRVRPSAAAILAGSLLWAATLPVPVRAGEPANSGVAPSPSCSEPIRAAEERGRSIFEQDQASAWATDALLSQVPRDSRVQGWVTTREGRTWTVHFIGLDGESPMVLHQVRFAEATPAATRVSHLEPPRPAEGPVLAMFRARQAAMRQPFEPCTPTYNTVIFRDPGSAEWIVYLLAATDKPEELVLGRHLRRTVAADGSKVLSTHALSKGCIVMPQPRVPPGAGVAGAYVTHLVTPCPTEGHVFASLLYRTPIYVMTSTGLWKVEQGVVSFQPDKPPAAK